MSDYKIRVDVGSDYSLAVESAKINNNLDDLKVKIIDVKKENDKNVLTFSDGKRMVVKDGATPYIGADGYWYIDGKPTKVKAMAIHSFNELTPDEKKELKGEPGKDGERGVDGKNGVDGKSIKITDTQRDKNGNILVTFSDNTQIQIPKGEKGDKGTPFTRDDFTEEDWEALKGEKGQSIAIRESTQQEDGSTLVIFSDNTEIVIPKGQKGDALKLDDLSDEDKKELLNLGLDLSEYVKKTEIKNPWDFSVFSKLDIFEKIPVKDTTENYLKLSSGYYYVGVNNIENQPTAYGIIRVAKSLMENIQIQNMKLEMG